MSKGNEKKATESALTKDQATQGFSFGSQLAKNVSSLEELARNLSLLILAIVKATGKITYEQYKALIVQVQNGFVSARPIDPEQDREEQINNIHKNHASPLLLKAFAISGVDVPQSTKKGSVQKAKKRTEQSLKIEKLATDSSYSDLKKGENDSLALAQDPDKRANALKDVALFQSADKKKQSVEKQTIADRDQAIKKDITDAKKDVISQDKLILSVLSLNPKYSFKIAYPTATPEQLSRWESFRKSIKSLLVWVWCFNYFLCSDWGIKNAFRDLVKCQLFNRPIGRFFLCKKKTLFVFFA